MYSMTGMCSLCSTLAGGEPAPLRASETLEHINMCKPVQQLPVVKAAGTASILGQL